MLAALSAVATLLVGCSGSAASRTATAAVATALPTETLTPGGDYLRIEGEIVRAVFVPDPEQTALYAFTDERLYLRTTDGWQPTNTRPDERRLIVNPQLPEELLRGASPPCHVPSDMHVPLEISLNSGSTWRSVTNGVNVRPDAFDTELPDVVYGSACRMMLSTDDGLTWSEVATAPFRAIVSQLPYDTHVLVLDQASEQMRQLHSVNLNDLDDPQFSEVLLEAPDLRCMAVDGERIVAGGLRGVYVSTDGGATWSRSRVGLESVTLEEDEDPLPHTTDRPSNIGVLSLSLDPEHAAWILAGTAHGLYISQDNGATWDIYDEVARDARVLAIQPASAGADLYVTTEQGVVLVPHP